MILVFDHSGVRGRIFDK